MALIRAAQTLSRILNATTRVRGFKRLLSHAGSEHGIILKKGHPSPSPCSRFWEVKIQKGHGRVNYKQVIRTWEIVIHHILNKEV